LLPQGCDLGGGFELAMFHKLWWLSARGLATTISQNLSLFSLLTKEAHASQVDILLP
jgi:hypothetical protein